MPHMSRSLPPVMPPPWPEAPKMLRLILMGPPGAGKGVQAKHLFDSLGLIHLASGDLLRAEQKRGTEQGRLIGRYIDQGHLVPDELIVDTMMSAIAALAPTAGFLLDGFPRTVEQAVTLTRALSVMQRPLHAVVLLNVPEDLLVARINGRRSCPQCGRAYHTEALPPVRDNLCDACGTPLMTRRDDTEAVLRERITAYHALTKPVLQYYRSGEHRLVVVDGAGEPDRVAQRLDAALRQGR